MHGRAGGYCIGGLAGGQGGGSEFWHPQWGQSGDEDRLTLLVKGLVALSSLGNVRVFFLLCEKSSCFQSLEADTGRRCCCALTAAVSLSLGVSISWALPCPPLGAGRLTRWTVAAAAAPRPAPHTPSPVAVLSTPSMDTRLLARQTLTAWRDFSPQYL